MSDYRFMFCLDSMGEKLTRFVRENGERVLTVSGNPESRIGLVSEGKYVVISDKEEAAGLFDAAKVAIAYAPSGEVGNHLLDHASHAIYTEDRLCQFLRQLL